MNQLEKRKNDKQLERNYEICRRVSAGETYEAIATSYGVSRQRIEQIILRYAPDLIGFRKANIIENHRRICEILTSGMKFREVAVEVGSNASTIQHIWKETATAEQIFKRSQNVAKRRLKNTVQTTKRLRENNRVRQQAAHLLLSIEAEKRGLTRYETALEILSEYEKI